MENKHSDGINNPVSHSTRKSGAGPVFYNASETPPSIRELLDTLPSDLFPKEYVQKLIKDLEKHSSQLLDAAQKSYPPLEKDDAEALFVYTYELYEPTLIKVTDIDAATLAKVLKKMKVTDECVKNLLNSAIDGACLMDQGSPATELTNEKIHARFPKEGEALAVIRARDELRRLGEICLGDYDCGKKAKNQIYGCMNRTMRDTNETSQAEGLKIWSKWIHRIELSLKKIPPLTEKKELFRGVSSSFNYVQYAPGKDFSWPAFSSTSASKKVGKEFAHKGTGKGTLFIANAISGRNISMFSKFPEEEEFLLPPNVHFTVQQGMTPTMMQMAECEQIIVLEETEKPSGAIFDKLIFEPTAYEFWTRNFGSDEKVTWSDFEAAHLKFKEEDKIVVTKGWQELRMQQYKSPQQAAAYTRFALAFCDQETMAIQDLKSAVVTVSSFESFLRKWQWMDIHVVLKKNFPSGNHECGDLGKVIAVDVKPSGGGPAQLELTVKFPGKGDLVVEDIASVEREVSQENSIGIIADSGMTPTPNVPGMIQGDDRLTSLYGYHSNETLMFTSGNFKGEVGTVIGLLTDSTLVVDVQGKRQPLYKNTYYTHLSTYGSLAQLPKEDEHIKTYATLWKNHGPVRVKKSDGPGDGNSTSSVVYPKHALMLLRRTRTEVLLEPIVEGKTVILADARTKSTAITVRPDGVVTLCSSAKGEKNQMWLPTVGGLFNSVADSSKDNFYLGFRFNTYEFPNETGHRFHGAYACLIDKTEVGDDYFKNKYCGSLRRSPISLETNAFFLYCDEETAPHKHMEGTIGVLGLATNWLGDPVLLIARVPLKTDSATLEIEVDYGCCNCGKTMDFVGRDFAFVFRPLYFQNFIESPSYLSLAVESLLSVEKRNEFWKKFSKKEYLTITSAKQRKATSSFEMSNAGSTRASRVSVNITLESSLLANNPDGVAPIQPQDEANEKEPENDILCDTVREMTLDSPLHISTVTPSQLSHMMLVDTIFWSVDLVKDTFPTQAALRCNASMPCDVDVIIKYEPPSDPMIPKVIPLSIICHLRGGRKCSENFTLTGPVIQLSVDLSRDIPLHKAHCPSELNWAQEGGVEGKLPSYLQDMKIDRSTDLKKLIPGFFLTEKGIFGRYSRVVFYTFYFLVPISCMFVSYYTASVGGFLRSWTWLIWFIHFMVLFWPTAAPTSFVFNNREELHEDLVANSQTGTIYEGVTPGTILLSQLMLFSFLLPQKVFYDFWVELWDTPLGDAGLGDSDTEFSFTLMMCSYLLAIFITQIGSAIVHNMFMIANRVTYYNVQRFITSTANNPEVLIETDSYLRRYMSLVHRVDVTRESYRNIVIALHITNGILFFTWAITFGVLWFKGLTLIEIYHHYAFLSSYILFAWMWWSFSYLNFVIQFWSTVPEQLCGLISSRLEYLSRIPGFNVTKYLELLDFIRKGQPIHWHISFFIRPSRVISCLSIILFFLVVITPQVFYGQLKPTTPFISECQYQFVNPSVPCSALPAPNRSNTQWVNLFPLNYITYSGGYTIPPTNMCVTNTTKDNCTYSSNRIPVSCAGFATKQATGGVYNIFVDPSDPGYDGAYNALVGITKSIRLPFKCDSNEFSQGQPCVMFRVTSCG